MRIITLNVNGIRSAASKGFFTWAQQQNADIICLQETRAHQTQLQDPLYTLPGYQAYFCDAEKKGYSGVALYTRLQPDNVTYGLGWSTADTEGRYVQADFGNLSVASVYLPSGTSGAVRQQIKFEFLNAYEQILLKQKQQQREYILCGDFNMAHKNIDLKNWRSNQKNSGFLPEERAWLDKLFDELGYVDAFRVLNQEAHQYTWWSNRGQAWSKNVGWRIDYQIVTPNLKPRVQAVNIYKTTRFSDHAPCIVDYVWP